jgi:hypothetical protein
VLSADDEGEWSEARKLPATAAPACNCQLTKPLATELIKTLATSKAMKPPATFAPEWVPRRCLFISLKTLFLNKKKWYLMPFLMYR